MVKGCNLANFDKYHASLVSMDGDGQALHLVRPFGVFAAAVGPKKVVWSYGKGNTKLPKRSDGSLGDAVEGAPAGVRMTQVVDSKNGGLWTEVDFSNYAENDIDHDSLSFKTDILTVVKLSGHLGGPGHLKTTEIQITCLHSVLLDRSHDLLDAKTVTIFAGFGGRLRLGVTVAEASRQRDVQMQILKGSDVPEEQSVWEKVRSAGPGIAFVCDSTGEEKKAAVSGSHLHFLDPSLGPYMMTAEVTLSGAEGDDIVSPARLQHYENVMSS